MRFSFHFKVVKFPSMGCEYEKTSKESIQRYFGLSSLSLLLAFWWPSGFLHSMFTIKMLGKKTLAHACSLSSQNAFNLVMSNF